MQQPTLKDKLLKYSNTTLVKVKSAITGLKKTALANSNTTLVKVKSLKMLCEYPEFTEFKYNTC